MAFRKGANHLVLKIQNAGSDWAFSCRPLGPEALTEKLIASVRTGHLDPVATLLNHGVDVNGQVGPGLTALRKAMKAKKFDVLTYLEVLQKGLRVMDTTAISLCMDNHLPIIVYDLKRKGNLRRIVKGERIGTLVKE